jgi:hypothetical protein
MLVWVCVRSCFGSEEYSSYKPLFAQKVCANLRCRRGVLQVTMAPSSQERFMSDGWPAGIAVGREGLERKMRRRWCRAARRSIECCAMCWSPFCSSSLASNVSALLGHGVVLSEASRVAGECAEDRPPGGDCVVSLMDHSTFSSWSRPSDKKKDLLRAYSLRNQKSSGYWTFLWRRLRTALHSFHAHAQKMK